LECVATMPVTVALRHPRQQATPLRLRRGAQPPSGAASPMSTRGLHDRSQRVHPRVRPEVQRAEKD
jgi:hypothetical protein